MAYERQDYLGTRADTTLNGSINDSTTSVTITSATGWPTVANSGHYAVIDPDSATEEKVLVTARTGTGLTVTRGVDGTTAVAHSSGATVRPCISATDFDEANYMVAKTVGRVTTAGDLLVADGANSLTRLAKGSNSTVLAVDSGGTLGYTTVTNAMITAATGISLSKLESIANNTVLANTSGSSAAPSAVTLASLFGGAWTTVTKASNESRSSVTVQSIDSELAVSGLSSGSYEVFGCLVYASPAGGATPGIKVAAGDNGEENTALFTYRSSAGTPTQISRNTLSTDTISAETSASKRVVLVNWVATASTGFGIYWAQEASSADPTILYAGSQLRYRALT